MTAAAFTAVQTAAVAGAVLVAGVAAFQVALTAGLPLGGAVLGGSAATTDGVLPGPLRVLALAQALLLTGVAWVLLARTDVVPIPLVGAGAVVAMVWGIVLLLALNTVGNLAAPHPVERWVMGPITCVLTLLTLFIALRAPTAAPT